MTFLNRLLVTLFVLFCVATTAHAKNIDKITTPEVMKFLSGNKGRVVIVNFWATWCGPCRQEFPGLVALRTEYPESALAILGISVDNNVKPVETFVEQQKANFPIFVDAGDVSQTFAIKSIPRTLIFDRNGEKVVDHLGYISLEDFRHVLQKLQTK